MIYWLWKFVTASLTITTSLTETGTGTPITSGPTGTKYTFGVNVMEGTTPDVGESVSVLLTAPDGTESTFTGVTDASGNYALDQQGGVLAGEYKYDATVGGEAAPTVIFTQSLTKRVFPLAFVKIVNTGFHARKRVAHLP